MQRNLVIELSNTFTEAPNPNAERVAYSLTVPAPIITTSVGLTPAIPTTSNYKLGEYVSFVGRASVEKGIEEFIEAARLHLEIPFAVVGSIDEKYNYLKESAPNNITWTGFLSGSDLDDFYEKSRIIHPKPQLLAAKIGVFKMYMVSKKFYYSCRLEGVLLP